MIGLGCILVRFCINAHTVSNKHTRIDTHTHTHTHYLSVSWLDPHGRRLNARRTHTLVSGRGHRLRDSLWSAESRRCTTSSSSLYTLATSKPPPVATNTPPHGYELRPRHAIHDEVLTPLGLCAPHLDARCPAPPQFSPNTHKEGIGAHGCPAREGRQTCARDEICMRGAAKPSCHTLV